MSTVINTFEAVKDLQLNPFERASTQLPTGTQTFSISSVTEQFISVNSEAESNSRIWLYFPLINPFAGIICTKPAVTHKCYTMQRQHLPRERSLWWGSAPREGIRQSAMTQVQRMLLVRNIYYLQNHRSGWVLSSLLLVPPANITGLVLQCGLTAQKTDVAGKSHIHLTSLGKKAQTKTPTNPNPNSLCLHRGILCYQKSVLALGQKKAQHSRNLRSIPIHDRNGRTLTRKVKISLNKEWLHDCLP